MATVRFWARRTKASPPAFYKSTPYYDRLILADPFREDNETRANAEDIRADRMRVVEAATSTVLARSRR